MEASAKGRLLCGEKGEDLTVDCAGVLVKKGDQLDLAVDQLGAMGAEELDLLCEAWVSVGRED